LNDNSEVAYLLLGHPVVQEPAAANKFHGDISDIYRYVVTDRNSRYCV